VRWRIDVGPLRWADTEEARARRASLKAAGATIHTTDDGEVVTITVSAPTENDANLRAAKIFREAVLDDLDAYQVRLPISIEPLP
jgi:hypothetical protein